jgi:hypothetical protein
MIQYINDVSMLSAPRGAVKIILHFVNNIGMWGCGDDRAYVDMPVVSQRYRRWRSVGYDENSKSPFCPGFTQFVKVAGDTFVVNAIVLFAQAGQPSSIKLDLDALKRALTVVAQVADKLGASINVPKNLIDINGEVWPRLEPELERLVSAKGVAVYAYEK